MDNITFDELTFRSIKGKLSASEQAALRAWRQASPECEARYQAIKRLISAATEAPLVSSAERPTAASVIRVAERAPASHWWRRHDGRLRAMAWVPIGTAAAALLVLGVALARRQGREAVPVRFGAEEFVTASSETATVRMSDGSVVRLAPDSRLRVAESVNERVVFLQGRAYFDVAKQHGLRFTVRTSAGDAVVLGTRFQIDTRENDLRLVVVEGRVALRPQSGARDQVEVGAGEMSQVVDGATSSPIKVADARALTGWAGRVLVFQSTPLDSAALEIERQYGGRIQIGDSSLATRTISGWFVNRSFEEVVRVMCAAVSAQCTIESRAARMEP